MPVPPAITRFVQLRGACLVCAQSCDSGLNLCNYCTGELPYLGEHCSLCGEAQSPASMFEGRCGRCLSQPPGFDGCIGVFHYTSPIDSLIAAFKYHGRFAAGHALAEMMCTRMAQHIACQQAPQLLVPVPLHWRRLRQRGFNQAWLLCRLLSRRLGIPAQAAALVKRRNTEPQSALTGAARRRRNLRGAFDLAPGHRLQDVKHIAIIDDVVTTMSTANELANLLRSHGIRRIELWCLARAKR